MFSVVFLSLYSEMLRRVMASATYRRTLCVELLALTCEILLGRSH